MKDNFFLAASGWTFSSAQFEQTTSDTHLFPGDTSESHRSLNLIQELVLLDDIMYILHQSSGNSSGVTSVGVKGLDDFLDCYGGMTGSPSIVVGRGADQSVAIHQRHVVRG